MQPVHAYTISMSQNEGGLNLMLCTNRVQDIVIFFPDKFCTSLNKFCKSKAQFFIQAREVIWNQHFTVISQSEDNFPSL